MIKRVLMACVLLVVVDTLAWRVAAGRVRDGVAVFRAGMERNGWRVESDPPVLAGWPVVAGVRLGHARLRQSGTGGLAWSAESLALAVTALHPGTLVVTPRGGQAVGFAGLGPVLLRAEVLEGRASLADLRAWRVSARAVAVQTGRGEAMVDAAGAELGWREGAAQARLTMGPALLPAGQRWGLGRVVASAGLAVVMHGGWPAGGAAGWRDGGGWLDVTRAAVRWGSLDAVGSGALRLDAEMQPVGTLDVRVADPQAALSMLADGGAISRGAATAAGAVLGLLALPGMVAGQSGTLDVPVRLDGGLAYLGQIPLAEVPKLPWQGER